MSPSASLWRTQGQYKILQTLPYQLTTEMTLFYHAHGQYKFINTLSYRVNSETDTELAHERSVQRSIDLKVPNSCLEK